MRASLAVTLLLMAGGCTPKAVAPVSDDPGAALARQRELADQEGVDQTLELVRLASLGLAQGDAALAEQALRRAVGRMQDFRADGQFRAVVGAEDRKEWKGEPYEKMMGFLYLGLLLYQKGDHANALAMTKSAILADTGTTVERFRSDFVPGFVLQGLAYQALGERANAERSLQHAADALWTRALVDHLGAALDEVDTPGGDSAGSDAARILLRAGLPAGLTAHPREPLAAIEGALSYATDVRGIALEDRPKDWPDALTGLRRADLKAAFDHLGPLAKAWSDAAAALPNDVVASLEADEAFLLSLAEEPGTLLWLERGRGPSKVAFGEYQHILRIVAHDDEPGPPAVVVDGRPVEPHYLDSVAFQAQTRGGRAVDGFLAGKAVFKESAGLLGWMLIQSGDLARAMDDDDSVIGAILTVAGAAVWVAGIATNPRADVRQWETLPDTLWLVRLDVPPGDHALRVDGRAYTVQVPDDRETFVLVPRLPPGGAPLVGEPCRECSPPMAIPGNASGGSTP